MRVMPASSRLLEANARIAERASSDAARVHQRNSLPNQLPKQLPGTESGVREGICHGLIDAVSL